MLLDAFPIDGKMQLQVPLTKEEREAKFGPRGGAMRQQAQQDGGFQPRNAGQQQRQQAQQRFGNRGPSQPQPQQFGQQPPPYTPDPNAGGYPGDEHGEDPYPGSRIAANQWDIHGQIINDARQLPNDHPDYLPFS